MNGSLTTQAITAVVLAAGKGKRMAGGNTPKVLHRLAGKTMLDRVVATLRNTLIQQYCVVLSENIAPFTSFLETNKDIAVCIQKKQNGTASAVASAALLFKNVEPIPYSHCSLYRGTILDPNGYVIICAGDIPNMDAKLIDCFIQYSLAKKIEICILGMEVPDPTGYGRLLFDRQSSVLQKIVEDKDASVDEKKIKVCNSGIMLAKTHLLFDLLQQVRNQNSQGEYYLTDCVELAQRRTSVGVYITTKWQMFVGVNNKAQLQSLAEYVTKNNH
jgi:bifunctional UDP-N-acetylglucosamine pyrophosphorylase/glucosamine-1-phosphate N-acetyltransferase